MKLDTLIRWFMPKEERFHDLFAKTTANLAAAARVFAEIAKASDLETRRVKMTELKDLEHKGDHLTRQIFEALNSTFITPLDREDIRSLANDLDDVLDYSDGVARYIILFELDEAPEALQQFAEILVKMVDQVETATSLIWDLSNTRPVNQALVAISELENRADQLYQTVIAGLFKGQTAAVTGKALPPGTSLDPLVLLKWKEVYDGLENACDACKATTYILGNILIKGV